MSGLIDLPQTKWGAGTGRQVILKGDFAKIETALPQLLSLHAPPTIQYVDATAITVPASADSPAQVMMLGFPDVVNYGQFITGGLTDNRYRVNTSNANFDFDVPASFWGTEKADQWYVIYALAQNADTTFTVKAMPFLRFKSQASQVISLGNLVTPATGIGYGFTTNAMVGGQIYVLKGASKGLLRAITANNNDNSTGGSITYSGAALTMSQGDWFVVLPPGTNFRWLGSIYNNSSSNILSFDRFGDKIQWTAGHTIAAGVGNPLERLSLACPLAIEAELIDQTGGGNNFGYSQSSGFQKTGAAFGKARFCLSFCSFYMESGNVVYPIMYAYPGGCGY